MKIFRLVFILTALLSTTVFAQDPCFPNGCRTQTQGGWGQNCNGNNNGCLRDANFVAVFPAGLTVGGNFTIHFSTSAAVNAFLPAGSTPGVLSANYNNPTSTTAGVFAGQVTALAVSLGFSSAGVPSFCNLGSLYYLSVFPYSPNPFVGMTVNELFALANQVLGGNLGALPNGTTVSDLNDVISSINENFVDGTTNNGDLVSFDCDQELAAELISFSGIARDGVIELYWTTASESDVQRFEIERTTTDQWMLAGIVSGLGDSPVGHSYRFTDENVNSGEAYSYRLVDISWDGSRNVLAQVVTVEAGNESAMPTEFALQQNYPNPFNPNTQISFSLPEASSVTLIVFDALGRNVSTLVSSALAAGNHTVGFDASDLSAGIYFYQLKAGDFSVVRKMMLIK